MPRSGQRTGQVPGRLGRPHQQRHRIPTSLRIHQRLQRARPTPGRSTASFLRPPPGARTRTAGSAIPCDLTHPTGDRVRMHPGRRRDRLDPTPAQLLSLHPEQQTTLPLIQMRTQHRIPARRRLRDLRHIGHSTTIGIADRKTYLISSRALTIGQLAAYAGVTVRAVRHYHQIGLLPEPQRDASGYRRYGATAVVSLIKIRTLAEAGVPLSQIAQMLEADASTFAEAVHRIDSHLRDEIERLETSRKQIAQLTAGHGLALPPEVAYYLDRLREIGASERMVEAERDGWILVAARWPDRIREWMPAKLAELDNPQLVRLYRVGSEIFDSDAGDGDPRLEELADIMAAMAEQAYASGEINLGEVAHDDLPFDLLDALAVESDPRAQRLLDLMRERGWAGWTRLERLAEPPG